MTTPASAPQRVALLGSYAPSLTNFRGPLIAEIVRRGHRVFAMAPAIDEVTARRVTALGAEPRSVALSNSSLDARAALRSIAELRGVFEEIRPDVVIAYTIKPIVLGASAAKAAGVSRFVPIVTGLGYAFTGGREPKRLLSRFAARLLYGKAFRDSTVAIFQNPDDLAEFHRLRLLPASLPTALIAGSGVDLDHYAPAPLPPGPSFLMMTRLLRDKGVREFAEAARRLKVQHPEVRISLAGYIDPSPDSINQDELDGMIADGVTFLGKLDDVRPAIAEHSVYLLPSYREGTPRSVLEAMAMGRPAITTDAPGCRETVIDGKTGFLIPPRKWEPLLDAMRRFVDDPASIASMGEAAQRFVRSKFDVRKVNEEILRLAGL